MGEDPAPDFTVEQWGIYEAPRVSGMPDSDFRDFVLRCYGATRVERGASRSDIHGWRNSMPIWVGAPAMDSQATARDVQEFANAIGRTVEYRDANLRDGVMLAWGFAPDAARAANQLRDRERVDVNFVRLRQIPIGGGDFREHIVGALTDRADYSEFLTFVQPPPSSRRFAARAKSSAGVVLPTRAGPMKMYEWASRPPSSDRARAPTALSCPAVCHERAFIWGILLLYTRHSREGGNP